jgi:hypothetical protein
MLMIIPVISYASETGTLSQNNLTQATELEFLRSTSITGYSKYNRKNLDIPEELMIVELNNQLIPWLRKPRVSVPHNKGSTIIRILRRINPHPRINNDF